MHPTVAASVASASSPGEGDQTSFADSEGQAGPGGQASTVLRWLLWVLGLAVLWYVLGFATNLAAVSIRESVPRERLALPLFPNGYGRLLVGSLVASTAIGLIGRRAGRVYPAGLLALATAWAVTYAALPKGPHSVYGNDVLVAFGTVLLAVSTLVGLGLGVWGACIAWRRLLALSVVAAVAGSYLVGSFLEVQNAILGQLAFGAGGSTISRWLTLAALFGLALAIAALGRAPWLLLTAISSVLLPLSLTVLGYLSQLLGPGVAGNVVARILEPIADLVPEVLQTAPTWWPPLAVAAGGVIGLLVWQARRSQRDDMPVLDPAHPVTTGDPGGRTPRRGDDDV